MRLLNVHNWRFEDFVDERRLPRYAILSHTWGDKEVQYHHMLDLDEYLGDKELDFYKIRFLCKQAIRDCLEYAWIDTCCINKESSAELSEAINSMFRWYQESAVCYVYMSDVTNFPDNWEMKRLVGDSVHYINHTNKVTTLQHPALFRHFSAGSRTGEADECHSSDSEGRLAAHKQIHAQSTNSTDNVVPAEISRVATPLKQIMESRWFTRGWTLQELIAPYRLRFYDAHGIDLRFQGDVIHSIEKVTGIPIAVPKHTQRVSECSIAMRMSWASKRRTTRIEDEAYCMLGIFDVIMPLLYGEGAKAFARLQEEIIKSSDDQSILAWDRGSSDIDEIAEQNARDMDTNYINGKWKKLRSRRHVGLSSGAPYHDSVRLSSTKKLYIEFDPTSVGAVLGTYMRLEIVSETRWSISRSRMQNAKRILRSLRLRSRAGRFAFGAIVMPVMIIPLVIELILVRLSSLRSTPCGYIAAGILHWLTGGEYGQGFAGSDGSTSSGTCEEEDQG